MRILYDHQMFAIQKFGGISRIFIELMRELVNSPEVSLDWYRGWHIDNYNIGEFRAKLNRYQAFPRYNIPKIDYNALNKFNLKLFAKSYDIYHPSYYDASLLEIVKTKKLVVTVYDMILELFLGNLERFQKQIQDKKTLIEKADLILVISENTKKDLLKLMPLTEPAKIKITPLATRIKAVKEETLPDIGQQKPYFLYVGTRSKYKNFELLIQAFAASSWLQNNFNVVCFGGSGDFNEAELKALKEANLIDKFIYQRGGDRLLKSLYQNAQALVYTSRYEGFGLPPLEAMECGCPVLCCPTSSLPEVVGEAALFFQPDHVDELINCMIILVEDKEKRGDLIEQGKNRARLFSWEKTAELTLKAYQELFNF